MRSEVITDRRMLESTGARLAGGGLGPGLPMMSNAFLLRDLKTNTLNSVRIFFSVCEGRRRKISMCFDL